MVNMTKNDKFYVGLVLLPLLLLFASCQKSAEDDADRQRIEQFRKHQLFDRGC